MTVPLNTLFNVTYGNKLDANKTEPTSIREGGINFVGRSSQRHGISEIVKPIPGVNAFPAGDITVALGGSKLLTSFVQLSPFYTAQNVAVLHSKTIMSMAEKLFMCLCIQHNRFRYTAFGREANRTLRTLLVPSKEEFPKWLASAEVSSLEDDHSSSVISGRKREIDLENWLGYSLSELFEIRKGVRLTQAQMKEGSTPFISAIDSNNGLRQRISEPPIHPAGTITVNYNGNGVAEAFYQPEPFFASDDVNVLYPRFKCDEYIALFFCTIIRREKYRFSYGRKWTLERMKESIVYIPTMSDESPDWNAMRSVIQSAKYSGAIQNNTTLASERAV